MSDKKLEIIEENHNQECCQNCLHFFEHYICVNGKYIPVFCGHCDLNKIEHGITGKSSCGSYRRLTAKMEHEIKIKFAKQEINCVTETLNEILKFIKE